MKQKVLLVCKIYLFCIYFSLINFNYPKKSMAIPSKFTRGGPAGNSRRKNNTSLGFGPRIQRTLKTGPGSRHKHRIRRIWIRNPEKWDIFLAWMLVDDYSNICELKKK